MSTSSLHGDPEREIKVLHGKLKCEACGRYGHKLISCSCMKVVCDRCWIDVHIIHYRQWAQEHHPQAEELEPAHQSL